MPVKLSQCLYLGIKVPQNFLDKGQPSDFEKGLLTPRDHEVFLDESWLQNLFGVCLFPNSFNFDIEESRKKFLVFVLSESQR